MLLVDPRGTVVDAGAPRPTPADAFAGGAGGLLDRVAGRFDGEGVLLLTAAAAELVAELVDAEPQPAGDWKPGAPGVFTTWQAGGRPAVHVARVDQVAPERGRDVMTGWRMPLHDPGLNARGLSARLTAWHDLTGCAYRGTPGVAGTAILRRLLAGRAKAPEPRWHLAHEERGWHNCEREYGARMWTRSTSCVGAAHDGVRPCCSPRWLHAYDLTDAYPAAAGSVLVARDDLRHTGRIDFDPARAGYWRVRIAPWPVAELPDPAGYTSARGAVDDAPRWVTTPTLVLLDELREQGRHGGYQVSDSYTAKGYQELKPFRLLVRDARAAAGDQLGGDDGAAIARALKQAMREALGMADRRGGRVYRPDWWHAVVALTRCNLFRKLDAIGKASGRYPVRIATDCAYYAGHHPDPADAAPRGMQLTAEPTAGKFKIDHDGTEGISE